MKRTHRKQTRSNIWVLLVALVIIVIGIGGFVMNRHQRTHFNRSVKINGIDVGGLTADEALARLKKVQWSNQVYVGQTLIVTGKTTSAHISQADLPALEKIMQQQYSFFPHKVNHNYHLQPQQKNSYRENVLRQALQTKLEQLNQKRNPAQDAYAQLVNNKVTVVPARKGNQYNVAKIMQEYDHQLYQATIRLKKKIVQPVTATSATVKRQQRKLDRLVDRQVEYTVVDKKHTITVADAFSKVTYHDGKYDYDDAPLRKLITKINNEQGTLHKRYDFTTPGGSTITVQNESYGWELSTTKARKTLSQALLTGKKQVDGRQDIYGLGYNTGGLGYGLDNNGLGKTYAVISIAEQRAWLYRDGQMVQSFRVVTGNQATHEDTPTGVYYIMYKQSPSVLRGYAANRGKYEQKVSYWAQFTDSGCGFHDAGWRKDWSPKAYLNYGSGGCANTQPAEMAKAYGNLVQNEPVIVY
ncbi:L,D-transpeptidase family protein [Ligilactobacillus saerimneri]|uniref:L,D-transpeptidase family protein n=1 Tax=Ligilactobacillus saerimneri TaxID=228229 RepID=UPI0003FBA074|nr:L,D-transpeptidase family protein [Ligilactobacillus saerimneri]KRL74516.1 hypothetical protein FC54_GL001347 [Ligilactobacillus saerimneri DSM 16049]